MKLIQTTVLCFLFCLFIKTGDAIWCYVCNSATPGCADNFNWRGIGYLGEHCPEDNDICVKVTERKGADVTITRSCLSMLKIRPDIPPDHYEGCRMSTKPNLAIYVNNTIKEYDLKRNYYDFTEFCFCFLDHRCNDSNRVSSHSAIVVLGLSAIISIIRYFL